MKPAESAEFRKEFFHIGDRINGNKNEKDMGADLPWDISQDWHQA